MKVAFPTDDGTTISRHLGQARAYVVVTLEDGAQTKLEQRQKQHHGPDHHAHDAPQTAADPQPVSMDAIQFTPNAEAPADRSNDEHARHASGMFAPLTDCQVLIAGGMGQPAYDHAVGLGLQVILTGAPTIQAALEAYQAGTLQSDMRRVHAKH